MKDTNAASEAVKYKFETVVELVKSLPQKGSFQPSYGEAAKLYSYYKQSKFGPCNIPKPGFWDYINRAKWDAWSGLGRMPQQEAMEKYVMEIKVIYLRVKELDEFIEKEHEYAKILIPFCEQNDIKMSSKLIAIKKKNSINRQSDGVVPVTNINVNNSQASLHSGTNGYSEALENKNEQKEHSMLLEQTFLPIEATNGEYKD